MVAPPLIPPTLIWTLVVFIVIAVLHSVICFIQALHTPPDAWTKTYRIVGFPIRKE